MIQMLYIIHSLYVQNESDNGGKRCMFGRIKDYGTDGNKVSIEFEKGSGFIEIIKADIIRIFSKMDSVERDSKAICKKAGDSIKFNVSKDENGIRIATELLTIAVCDDFKTDIYDKDGQNVCSDFRGERKSVERISDEDRKLLEGEGHSVGEENGNYRIQVLKTLDNVKAFYGLGDKTGFLNKAGYQYDMWNTDNPDPQVDCFKSLYKSIPFFIALTIGRPYGIFFDNTFHSYFDMGKESQKYYYFAADEGDLDYYFILGDSMPDVIKGYTCLTGRTPLPQMFTLGYHQSRWSYSSADEVRQIADTMRKNRIPCDTIHLDIDYMDAFKVFTFSEQRFPNVKEFINDLSSNGFKIVTIIDPGVKAEDGYDIYEEGKKNGYFAKDEDGSIYKNRVWPGTSVFPDFGNSEVRKWWGDNQKYLVDMGVRGVWNDMNEPASFDGPLPDNVVFRDGDRVTNHKEIHNVYGHFMAQATYDGLKKYDGRRPYVITRACYAGSQKYTTAWTGDNHSIWAHLQMAVPQLCNMGISGIAFAGTDVGGFGSDVTPELLARWVQTGCFSPLFRNHSAKGTRYQEPWGFGDEVLDIYRKYVELRYRLIPYFYDLFHECEQTGMPVLRPLILNYPDDNEVINMNDEFMVGDSILVSPVVNPGQTKKMVYLPKGVWYDYDTKERIDGGTYIIKDAPLDVCPVYIKAGAVIPNFPVQQYIGEQKIEKLILDVYPGEGSCTHYQNDGESFEYQDGVYNEYRFSNCDGKVDMEIVHNGYKEKYKEVEIHYKEGINIIQIE